MKRSTFFGIVFVIGATLGLSSFAADKATPPTKDKKAKMEITAEQRQGLATAFENMGACLKTDKAFEECHKDMATTCKGMAEKGIGCPMMGHHGKGMHGKMRGHGHDEHSHHGDAKKQ